MYYSYIQEQRRKQRRENIRVYSLIALLIAGAILIIATKGYMRLWVPGGLLY